MNTTNEVSVPSAALAIDGVAPEVGDEIEVTLRGRVSGVRGESTVFTASEANGVPMPARPAAPADDLEALGGEDLSEEKLRAVASAYDQKAGGVAGFGL